MAQSILLPLRLSPPTAAWANLETRVRQIESQKGSFRTITEQDLQNDIEQAKSGAADVASESEESEEEDESPETKQKRLWEAKEEMLKQLLRAQNETLTALDSISLLISGHAKAGAGAKSSMSPALSMAVAHSTLDAQKVLITHPSLPAEQQNQSLYLGYKLESLKKAVDQIDSAKSRLNKQAHQESAFWKQVADLSAQGLVISRLPRDSRIIGVHFGFPEAAPKFRNRGFAVLRADPDGELRLDQAIATSKRYTVRVSITEGGKLTSISRPPTIVASETNIATIVADLRRSLFEEELFFEIGREARIVANQDVSTVGKTVVAKISGDRTMRIELVGHDEQSMDEESTAGGFADGVVLCLRGLLSKGHEKTLARRSQPPAPLLPKTLPLPEYALLRPLLSHMRHQMLVSTLQDYCDSLKVTMDTAGLFFDAKSSTVSVGVAGGLPSHRILLMDTMLAPADSIMEMKLPTGRKLEVKIGTHLAPPAFGTVFTASPVEYTLSTTTPPNMPNLEAVKSVICYMLTADIVELILDRDSPDYGSKQIWTSETGRTGVLKSHNAYLYVRTNVDTSLAVRYHKEPANASPADKAAWMWHADKMSKAPAGTHEVHQPQYLIEVVKNLSQKEN
jgi:mediator of RNA polymerase II transcription subunit 17